MISFFLCGYERRIRKREYVYEYFYFMIEMIAAFSKREVGYVRRPDSIAWRVDRRRNGIGAYE